MIHTGDCLDVMATFEAESIDAIVTDPPYGLEFMGKEWDRLDGEFKGGGPSGSERFKGWKGPRFYNQKGLDQQAFHQRWAEAAYRVAKPSAYLLAFGGTRTVHRMTVALEDAGWIIRDMLVWAYASGFPKSKASLKPAWEPIVMARKPGPLRMLAIDECRIPTDGEPVIIRATEQPADLGTLSQGPRPVGEVASASPLGRWPANVILTDPIFDGGWDGVVGGGAARASGEYEAVIRGERSGPASIPLDNGPQYGDSGTYSRFFLIPKADRSDREPMLGGHGIEPGNRVLNSGSSGRTFRDGEWVETHSEPRKRANHHPTVKPVDLMRHLVRLVTPAGGTVLDPFLGSGTTGLAAEMEGFAWVGIEKEPEYVAIAEARLNGTQRGLGLVG